MSLSTHVLDLAAGHPAAGIAVRADRWEGGWQHVADGVTDGDGRIAALVSAAVWTSGRWRLTFDLAGYHGPDGLFTAASVELNVSSADQLHIPLLLSPFGYTTYRGS